MFIKTQLKKKEKHLHPCTNCDKLFEYKSKLNEHLVIHNEKIMYSCPKCYRNISRKINFDRHVLKCKAFLPTNRKYF